MAQTLTEIKALLAAHGLVPKKRFGQNFLHDGNHMRRILGAADLQQGELVLEVGPGTGALSERLLEAGAKLLAVEVDTDLAPILAERLAPWRSHYRLILADVLAGKHDLEPKVANALASMTAEASRPGFKLIANLPYNVASPLLMNLLAMTPPAQLQRAVVMVQKEVAQRLAAGPGGKDYGPLGILVQAICTVQRVGVLPPSCFWPSPQVDSAVVLLTRRANPLAADLAPLASLVHLVFEKRRKQIGAVLRQAGWWDGAHDLPAGVVPSQRPEALSVEQLAALSRELHPPHIED